MVKKHKVFTLTTKQMEAFSFLQDNSSNIILYGGQANSGKSFLGSFWLILNCLKYPKTRWALCRSTFKDLKKSSLKTFKETAKKFFELDENIHYKINHVENSIYFYNGETKKFDGAEIFLMNLQYMPSDPDGDSFGGYELTGAVIDELPQITEKYFNVIFTRLRYNLDLYGLSAKLFCTCNPTTGWVKSFFYDRWIKDQLPNDIKFISTVGDNHFFRDSGHSKRIKTYSEKELKRLEYGDWDYAEDIDQLFNNDKIEEVMSPIDFYKRDASGRIINNYYLSVDVAGEGKDKTVICFWNHLTIEKIWKFEKLNTLQVSQEVIKIMNEYKIPKNKVITDGIGVGKGVVDNIGCRNFISNGKVYNNEKYDMLKSQCYFKLKMTGWSLGPNISREYRDIIKKELQSIKDESNEFVYKINNKDNQKKILGHSPDFVDAIMMRMIFLYSSTEKVINIY